MINLCLHSLNFIINAEAANPPSYPSSSKIKKDWDKIDKELSKEKDEESDVNTLFSKIFESGDDNTRKAMIKSMVSCCKFVELETSLTCLIIIE